MWAHTGTVLVDQEPDDAFHCLFGSESIFHPSHIRFSTIYGLIQMLICASMRLIAFLDRELDSMDSVVAPVTLVSSLPYRDVLRIRSLGWSFCGSLLHDARWRLKDGRFEAGKSEPTPSPFFSCVPSVVCLICPSCFLIGSSLKSRGLGCHLQSVSPSSSSSALASSLSPLLLLPAAQ